MQKSSGGVQLSTEVEALGQRKRSVMQFAVSSESARQVGVQLSTEVRLWPVAWLLAAQASDHPTLSNIAEVISILTVMTTLLEKSKGACYN